MTAKPSGKRPIHNAAPTTTETFDELAAWLRSADWRTQAIRNSIARISGQQNRIRHPERLALSGAVTVARR